MEMGVLIKDKCIFLCITRWPVQGENNLQEINFS